MAIKDMEHLASQEGVIERIANGQADIRLNGQILRWPVDQLPQPVQTGGKVKVLVTTPERENLDRETLAKTILNEILSGEDSK